MVGTQQEPTNHANRPTDDIEPYWLPAEHNCADVNSSTAITDYGLVLSRADRNNTTTCGDAVRY